MCRTNKITYLRNDIFTKKTKELTKICDLYSRMYTLHWRRKQIENPNPGGGVIDYNLF